MDGRLKFLGLTGAAAVLVFSAALLGGCTTKSKAHAQAQTAFAAGQNANWNDWQWQLQHRQEMQTNLAAQVAAVGQDANGVTVLGPVQNPHVPWVVGLTLAQAIATANYNDQREPREIVITRQGESAKFAPRELLNGVDVPLEQGDIIEIHP